MATDSKKLRILFFLWAPNYDRVFEAFVAELLRRGHSVEVLFEVTKGLPPGAGEAFEALAREHPGRLERETLLPRRGPRQVAAGQLRRTADYLRFLEPEYADSTALRGRARDRLSRATAAALDRIGRSRRGRARVRRVLDAVERSLPPDGQLVTLIRDRRPDVVLVAPLISLASSQADVVPAATALAIPAVLPVASWDNLTNKGLVRTSPTRTIVWNGAQRDEAIRLQRLPPDSVAVVGAHAYDHWFEWRSSTEADVFKEKVGLDPREPYLLYACSSAFIAGDETRFVREWLGRLRTAGGRLARVGVLVRPHPQNAGIWEGVALDDAQAVVWPRGGEVPTAAERKADYYDSIAHSYGVVGVNTSALVESAIVRRPVFTLLADEFRGTQSGTLHFAHLAAGGDRPLLNAAATWEEHLGQLARALDEPDAFAAGIDDFLHRFVRPSGLDRAAAPAAADVVEEAARLRPPPMERPRSARLAAGLLVAVARLRGAR